MDKLGQITIDNTLNVVVSCQVDQHLLAKNFTTIINALKDLQQAQLRNESQIKDLSSLKDKFDSLSEKVEKIEKAQALSVKESQAKQNKSSANQSTDNANILGSLSEITQRLDKNQANILDNIKDINLIHKEMAGVKKDIDDLKNKTSKDNQENKDLQSNNSKQENKDSKNKGSNIQGKNGNQDLKNKSNNEGKNDKNGYGINEVAGNMSKELSLNAQRMKDLQARLSNAEDRIKKLEEELRNNLKDNSSNKDNSDSKQSNERNNDLADLKKDMKEKLDIINQKLKNIQSQTDHHDQEISYIKDMLDQNDKNNEEIPVQALVNGDDSNKTNLAINSQLTQLRKKIQEVNDREKKDVKKINDEIANLKLLLKGSKTQKAESIDRGEGIQSKTSLQDQGDTNKKGNRKLILEKSNLGQKLNELAMKVNYLQKMISGSKHMIGTEEKIPSTGGLPAINRSKRKDLNLTGFGDRDKAGIGRKDLSEVKAELQAWITSLLDQGRDRQNSEDLYLKIQQIKHGLQKKADSEGTKKGLKFLQNKITQLYLFLTQPETQDAMIVRKGFNCLSCSKNVQRLRGKLGPRLNWNNMTSTNYSPPRVGYSKPMGEQTPNEKEDDL